MGQCVHKGEDYHMFDGMSYLLTLCLMKYVLNSVNGQNNLCPKKKKKKKNFAHHQRVYDYCLIVL